MINKNLNIRPHEIVSSFSGANAESHAKDYLSSEGLLGLLEKIKKNNSDRYSPDWSDLARLHQTIRCRRVFTILEFGIGFSTIVMADALSKNRKYWNEQDNVPAVRNTTLFQLHSVDAEREWIKVALDDLPANLNEYVVIHHSEVIAADFQGRQCHFYNQLPDCVPDFIYLDGPHPYSVSNSENQYSGWGNPDKVVMSGDLLRIEPWLLPGTLIMIDGRTSNARFLLANFYRNWVASRSVCGDITALELQESPLGKINEDTMKWCLGNVVTEWSGL
jgi:hypothetical protein